MAEDRPRRLIRGLAKQRLFCVSFVGLWSQHWSFQIPQSCQFLNRCLFPILTYGYESCALTEKGYLKCKRQRWDFYKELAA